MRIPRRDRSVASILLFAFAIALAFPAAAFAEHRERADFSRLVIVGDSLSAGFQNDSLLDSQQVNGYANLVAQQAHAPLILPLIAPPGIPNVLTLVSAGPPPIVAPVPGISTGRDNPTVQATDLAVPGAKAADVLNDRPATSTNVLTQLILGVPGLLAGINRSQIEWAEALHPTFAILWIGNNDVLGAALAGTPALATPVNVFQTQFGQIADRLAATGAKLTFVNIPDVTEVAALTPAETVAQELGIPFPVFSAVLGVNAGDLLTPNALTIIQNILTGKAAGPLPGTVVLTVAEQAQIKQIVNGYNAFIAAEAKLHGAALVNFHDTLDRINARGLEVRGQRLTTDFLGGLFSLDGVHPTNTGYAVIANLVIHAIDRTFDADIDEVSIERIAREDPLVPPRAHDHRESPMGHIDDHVFESVRSVMR